MASRIKQCLENNITEEFNLDRLCESLNYSKNHIINVFFEKYGVTPYNYYKTCKIQLAKEYLTNTQMTVGEISSALSFADRQYFPYAFKKTGKRLDASLPFVIGIGTMISGTIASAVAPMILHGTKIPIIAYVQAIDGVAQEQSLHTKVMLLFFYTVVHGLMMFLAGVAFFFYKLTGKTKQEVHEKVLAHRAALEKE